MKKSLQTELPDNPMESFGAWLAFAKAKADTPNYNAMGLSTVSVIDGQAFPSSRIVLLKDFDLQQGYIVFYTNYQSRKGQELASCERASAVLHWDKLGMQIRLEGLVLKSPEAQSNAYFESRGRGSRLGAWSSDQSQPIASRDALFEKLAAAKKRFEQVKDVPRPSHWGGYRLHIDRLELWCDGEHRIHDRALWQREIVVQDDLVSASDWRHQRLQP